MPGGGNRALGLPPHHLQSLSFDDELAKGALSSLGRQGSRLGGKKNGRRRKYEGVGKGWKVKGKCKVSWALSDTVPFQIEENPHSQRLVSNVQKGHVTYYNSSPSVHTADIHTYVHCGYYFTVTLANLSLY